MTAYLQHFYDTVGYLMRHSPLKIGGLSLVVATDGPGGLGEDVGKRAGEFAAQLARPHLGLSVARGARRSLIASRSSGCYSSRAAAQGRPRRGELRCTVQRASCAE